MQATEAACKRGLSFLKKNCTEGHIGQLISEASISVSRCTGYFLCSIIYF